MTFFKNMPKRGYLCDSFPVLSKIEDASHYLSIFLRHNKTIDRKFEPFSSSNGLYTLIYEAYCAIICTCDDWNGYERTIDKRHLDGSC